MIHILQMSLVWFYQRVMRFVAVRYLMVIASLVLFYAAWVWFYRQTTWAFLVPWWDTSTRVKIPTAAAEIIAFLGYLWIDVRGSLQKGLQHWLKEGMEKAWVAPSLLGLALLLSLGSFHWAEHKPPLKWASFIDQEVVWGIDDEAGPYKTASSTVQSLEKEYPEATHILNHVITILKLRNEMQMNCLPKLPSGGEEQVIGMLSHNQPFRESNQVEAFRLFGRGEALSALKWPKIDPNKKNLEEAREKDYKPILSMVRAITPDWQKYIFLHIGNTYYFMETEEGYQQALKEYRKALPWALAHVSMADAELGLGFVHGHDATWYDKAIQDAKRGLSLLSKEDRPSKWTTQDHLVLAEIRGWSAKGDFETAIDTYEEMYNDPQRPPNDALVMQYCLTLALKGDEEKFNDQIDELEIRLRENGLPQEICTRLTDYKYFLQGMWFLRAGNISRALACLRQRPNYRNFNDRKISKTLTAEWGNSEIRQINELLRQLHNAVEN